MARNKSEEVQKLKFRVSFLEARLRDMSKEATKGTQDAMSMITLVEEARDEAQKYKRLLGDAQSSVQDRKYWEATLFPWDPLYVGNQPLPALPARALGGRQPGPGAIGAAGPTDDVGARGADGSAPYRPYND